MEDEYEQWGEQLEREGEDDHMTAARSEPPDLREPPPFRRKNTFFHPDADALGKKVREHLTRMSWMD